jgi:hypothetical protein
VNLRGPAVLGVACLDGYRLGLRALGPVDEIASVARSISVQNLAQREAVPRTEDELRRRLAMIRAAAALALRRDREPGECRDSLRTIDMEPAHMTALTALLVDPPASAYIEELSGEPVGLAGGQEDHDIGDILGRATAAKRSAGGNGGLLVGSDPAALDRTRATMLTVMPYLPTSIAAERL